jgi:hypothetical protein
MTTQKPYAKPEVLSVSRQEFCAHCIDDVPVGTFLVDGKEFALCASCAMFLKASKKLPPIRETGKSLALFNTATRVPGLDRLERRAVRRAKRHAQDGESHHKAQASGAEVEVVEQERLAPRRRHEAHDCAGA